MNAQLLRAYHRLPAPARSLAATGWGWYLQRWRYGHDTERLVAEALERETWSEPRWQAWREDHLARILARAATDVPFYRAHWQERRRRGDSRSWERLEHWPILEKATVRAHQDALVADSCDRRRMYRDHTSGTSGTPLTVYLTRDTIRQWYALVDARWRRWYGVTREDRWAMLGGQLVVPIERRQPPFWVWNGAFRQLYLSSYHLAPDLAGQYLDAMVRHRVTYALGYSSSLYALARAALQQRRRDVTLRVVITNAEPLYAHQREAIEEAFGCPVRETYGMAEVVAAAGQCQAGRLHLWPEVGAVEVVDGDNAAPADSSGDLVCTGLLNADMPLVRYRVGDRGAIGPDSPCACGRRLPALSSVEGRRDDVLFTRDGRPIGRLDPIFKNDLPIAEAQIIQDGLDRIRVLCVPERSFTAAHRRRLEDLVRERMGDVAVVVEEVPGIPRGAHGKFRAVVCNLSPAERQQVARH